MQNGVIEILCNGDFPGVDIGRKYFTLADLEYLAEQREKAAATNSDRFKDNQ
ncbi:MAG: hypothetical protein PHQ46_06830 [Negativicutes bacterium]|nr:hypothetical protein [Negativicutes bacterium]